MSERIDRLADALATAGVGTLFGVPGSGASWELLTALEARAIPFLGMAHEGAAAMAAGAYSRHSGRLGASLSIKGPGLANMLPGLLSNHYEQWPAISVSEAYGPMRRGRAHKYLDQSLATSAFAKAYGRLGDPAEMVRRLAEVARAEVPGPVHLDLCVEDAPVFEEHHLQPPADSAAGISEHAAVSLLSACRRPVVIVGAFAARNGSGGLLSALHVPVFTTASAKGLINERLAHAAGVYTGDGKRLAPERQVLAEADAVVLVGVRATELLGLTPFRVPAFSVDVVDGGLSVTGAKRLPSGSLAAVLDAVAGSEWGDDVIARATGAMREALLADSWLPPRAVELLDQQFGAQAGLVVDTGAFCTIAEHMWRPGQMWQFTASANGRFMGAGIPMAIGSLCAHGRPTICLVGDGGMRMGVADLKLAGERCWPLLLVLMRDGRYGSIAAARGARSLNEGAVTIPRPGWVRAVEALEWPAAEAIDDHSFAAAIASWRPDRGPLFVEAVFEPHAYELMTRDLR